MHETCAMNSAGGFELTVGGQIVFNLPPQWLITLWVLLKWHILLFVQHEAKLSKLIAVICTEDTVFSIYWAFALTQPVEFHTVVSESSSALAEPNKWFFSPKSLGTPDSFVVELSTPAFQIDWLSYYFHVSHNSCENDRLETQGEIIPFSLKYMLGFLCFRRGMFVFAQTSLRGGEGYRKDTRTYWSSCLRGL